MARILLCSSAVRVHDSQAYRNMNVTRERFNRVLELREMLLSFQTGFNLNNAAILESISGLEPSSDTIEPRHLKFVHRFALISLLMPLVLFVVKFCLFGTDFHQPSSRANLQKLMGDVYTYHIRRQERRRERERDREKERERERERERRWEREGGERERGIN